MARTKNNRNINNLPTTCIYKPVGIQTKSLQTVNVTLDEFEAIRLADYEGLYQKEASEKMHVSRQTFGRIIEAAHKKIADAIVHGKAIVIEGGCVKISEPENKMCPFCEINGDTNVFDLPEKCIECLKSNNLINKQNKTV